MPGLPGSDPDDDIQMFKRIYEDDDFKPDYIKIYPTLVIKGTELYERWRAGTYEPISDEDAAVLIARVKEMLPRWTRLQRVQRDIPSQYIDAGVKKSNLRQLAKEKAKNCACIRCREVGHALLDGRSVNKNKIELLNQKYDACEGTEYFLSYEDVENDILIGFLRLRLTSDTHREELKNSALVRDLHVYGRLVPVGEKSMNKWQHKGYGASLLENAEYIASDEGFKKISVMSGVGVREYYSKFGYERDGPFMSKVIA
jgi:elongator complex protein 3